MSNKVIHRIMKFCWESFSSEGEKHCSLSRQKTLLGPADINPIHLFKKPFPVPFTSQPTSLFFRLNKFSNFYNLDLNV